ncbi:MAG: SBBP repeat-containing protein [Pirellulaceae bacterium]
MLSRLSRSAAWIGGRTSRRRLVPLYRALIVGLFVSACAAPNAAPPVPGLLQPSPPAASAVAPGVTAVPNVLPFPIEQNVGQADPGVGYLLRAGAMQVGFGASGPAYVLAGPRAPAGSGRGGSGPDQTVPSVTDVPAPGWIVRQELVGATKAMPIGTVASPTTISYFKGPAEQWLVAVPAFEQVAYTEAWPGITVTYERGASGPKSAYQVAAGADPGRIRLLYSGARVRVDEAGALVAETPLGELRESPPVAWQERDGVRTAVEARYALFDGPDADETEYGFALGTYDAALPLVIDPQIAYASFIGGPGLDQSRSIAVDGSGNAYVTGMIDVGATFPGSQATFDSSQNGDWDAFVAKLNPAGTGLLYASFIGGSGKETGFGIALDAAGSAYVAGLTESSQATFPISGGLGALATFDGTYNGGGGDGFVVKVNAGGTALMYAGYVGGDAFDTAWGIAVDAQGRAYVAGQTESSPTTFPSGSGIGSLPTINGTYHGAIDGFVVRVKADGNGLDYAAYIGGNGLDEAYGVAVDTDGNAYVSGRTESSEATFPTGNGMGSLPSFHRTYSGAGDVFLLKINPAGSGLMYAGYIGGSATDQGGRLAIDASRNAYVTGSVEGPFAPTLLQNGSGGAIPMFDSTFNGLVDGFVVKVNATGTGLVYAGYIGGDSADAGLTVAVDPTGGAFVVGYTTSSEFTFPDGDGFGTLSTFDNTYNFEGDGFLAKVKPDGSVLDYAGYLGGSGTQVITGVEPEFGIELAIGIAVDQAGNAYVAARSLSTQATFPDGLGMTGIPTFDNTFSGGLIDAVVVKVTPAGTCALAGRHAAAGRTNANYAYQYAFLDYITFGGNDRLYELYYALQANTFSQNAYNAHVSGNYATAKENFSAAAANAYYGYQYAAASYASSRSSYAYYAFLYGYYAQTQEYQAYVNC